MDFSAALTTDLHDLFLHLEVDLDVTGSFDCLNEHLGSTVASYVGLQLDLTDHGRPITFSSFEASADLSGIDSSLLVPLERFNPAVEAVDPGGTLTFYATTAGAFVDLAADLSHALRLDHQRGTADREAGPDSGHVQLDRHLTPSPVESGVHGATDVSTINRAVGFLIGEGCPPEDAHLELARRAARVGVSALLYADRLIHRTSR